MYGSLEPFVYFQCERCRCLQIAEVPQDLARHVGLNLRISLWSAHGHVVGGSRFPGKGVADNLNSTLLELKPTLQNFKTLSDSLKMLKLNQTLFKTQQAISNLNQTLAGLNKGDNTMSKLMTEDTLYVNLNKLLKSVDSLASHFNNNPKHFLSPLGKSKKKIERDRRKQEEAKKASMPKK